MTKAALATVSTALDLLGKDGPALGPPLVSAIASMTAIHAGSELLRECDPGFQFSADSVERTVTMSYLKELHPNRDEIIDQGDEANPERIAAIDLPLRRSDAPGARCLWHRLPEGSDPNS